MKEFYTVGAIMADAIYFFIDGGYIRRKYAESMKRVFNVDAAEPDISTVQGWCYSKHFGSALPQRFFYYDCLHDVRKDGESESDLKRRIAQQNDMFEKIQSLPGFHVRLGSLSGIGKKMRQKKVDVLLAVEMLDHAFRKNMAAAFLVAGDGDFTPVVEAVTRLGTWVQVFYAPDGASRELYSAADMGMPLSFNDFWSWGSNKFRERYPLPTRQPPVHFNVSSLLPMNPKTATNSAGQKVTLAERGDKRGEFFVYIDNPGGAILLIHSDSNVLEKYYGEQFETVAWI